MAEPLPQEVDLAGDCCISPTGTCFNDAMEILGALLIEGQVPPEDLRLVHGICRLRDGTRVSHAWVEHGTLCFFGGIVHGERRIYGANRPEYYRDACVLARTPYTPWQAARHNKRRMTYGPWKPSYLALARQPEVPPPHERPQQEDTP